MLRSTLSKVERQDYLEDNYGANGGGSCCLWSIFGFGGGSRSKRKLTQQQTPRKGRVPSQMGRKKSERFKSPARKQISYPVNYPKQDKHEIWSVYLLKNMQNLEGLVWAD